MPGDSTLHLLRQYESRNVTFTEQDGSWPIVWERARGAHVWDEGKRRYLDLTAAFGVAAAGHANPRVVRAGQGQMARLLHAMGDVHPHRPKAELARELSRKTFERWGAGRGKVIFNNAGFESVEAALKTVALATGKPRIIAFEGAYHGLGYGALNAAARAHFKSPFKRQLREFADFVPFPSTARDLAPIQKQIRQFTAANKIGAILVEPVQARGGIRIPPPEFLPMLREIADKNHLLLVLDEIYTGFGRTGRWFACEHSQVVPDLVCLGKALTGGFPLSACLGKADLMDAAWPESTGEAIHTSTFLGHPVGCAMALANLKELEGSQLVRKSRTLGNFLLRQLKKLESKSVSLHLQARGLGLMAGLELRHPDGTPATSASLQIIKNLLHRGFILLPEGEHANVISLTPPLTITQTQLVQTLRALEVELSRL